jgi:hypothetical protein
LTLAAYEDSMNVKRTVLFFTREILHHETIGCKINVKFGGAGSQLD